MPTAPAQSQARSQGLKKYQALTNLSVPMPGENKDGRTFLVPRGEVVELTEEQAHNLARMPGGKPAIRPVKEGSEPLPELTGRLLSGPIRRPPQPAPGSDAARPDPPGSSHIAVYRDPGLPELNEPAPGSEASDLGVTDALDIAPGTGTNVEGGLTAASRR